MAAAAWIVASGATLAAGHEPLAVRGQVVDAETGAPIAGAVVVAAWTVRRAPLLPGLTAAHSSRFRCVHVVERVTGADGRFDVPDVPEIPAGWEKDRRGFPMIWIFHPGFEPEWRDPGRLRTGLDTYREPLNPPALGKPYTEEKGALVALYRHGRAPIPSKEADWPVHRRGAREKALDKLTQMAAFLESNVAFAADMDPHNAATLENMRAERTALRLVDEEIRGLGAEPPDWWGPAREFVRAETRKARE